jgi:hypothetical protein
MSHFFVLVLLRGVDAGDSKAVKAAAAAALAPYQENNMGDCPRQYMTFHNATAECEAEWSGNNYKGEPHKASYPTLDAFITDYHGYSWDAEQKAYGSWENPNAKWDWRTLGGRFDGALTNNRHRSVNSPAPLGIEHPAAVPVLSLPQDFSCYAILTQDGKWNQRGEMGWFGMSSNEQSQEAWAASVRQILDAHQDCVAVAVDCHI